MAIVGTNQYSFPYNLVTSITPKTPITEFTREIMTDLQYHMSLTQGITNATYITVTSSPGLPFSRTLARTAPIVETDGGAGSTLTISLAYSDPMTVTAGDLTLNYADPFEITSHKLALNYAAPLEIVSHQLAVAVTAPIAVTAGAVALSYSSPLAVSGGDLVLDYTAPLEVVAGNLTTAVSAPVEVSAGAITLAYSAPLEVSGGNLTLDYSAPLEVTTGALTVAVTSPIGISGGTIALGVVPIANGGTNATTAAQALINLGADPARYPNTQTTSYNIASTDTIVVYNSASNGTFSLPTAVAPTLGVASQVLDLKNMGAGGTLTIAPQSTDAIDGYGTGVSLPALPSWGYVRLVAQAANQWITLP